MKHARNAFILSLIASGDKVGILPTIVLLIVSVIELRKFLQED